MKEIKIDDIFFKDKLDYSFFEDTIYTQFAKTMARNVDIDLAKTPLVDILTGYTRYREAEQEIDRLNKVLKYLEKHFQEKEEYENAELVRQLKEANIEWLENALGDEE